LLDRSAFFDPQAIFAHVTDAFAPVRDRDGRLRARDAGEIVRTVKARLAEDATETYRQALEDAGLDLSRALDLEVRYVALLAAGADFDALVADGALDDAVRDVSDDVVRQGLLDKLQRLSDSCVVLAQIDQTRLDDPSVTPAWIAYAGVAPKYNSDEPTSLGRLLKEVAPKLDIIEGWDEPDSLVLYRAVLGLSLIHISEPTRPY